MSESPKIHRTPRAQQLAACPHVNKTWRQAGPSTAGVRFPTRLPIRKRTKHPGMFPFLDLPPEIRNYIYEISFATDNGTHFIDDMCTLQYTQYLQSSKRPRTSYRRNARVWPSYSHPYPRTTYTLRGQKVQPSNLAMLRVNRQISREALGFLYSQRFVFASPGMVIPFLRDRSPKARTYIKKLAIREIIKGDIDSLLWSEPQRLQFSRDWEQMCAYLANHLDLKVFVVDIAGHCKEFTDTCADWIQQLVSIKGLLELHTSFTVFCKLREHHNPPGGPCYSNHREIASQLRSYLRSQMLQSEASNPQEKNLFIPRTLPSSKATRAQIAAETRHYFYQTYVRQQIDSPNS
ncbi:MAG: hypothetical protein M1836_007102 [Candelina mexicana]|nr:MAG: hypothetical protein M1836_007102 [Candelina mexicana]